MKKKATTRSAFINPRALLGFTLCLLGLVIAVLAATSLTSRSAHAQATLQRGSLPPLGLKPIAAAPMNLEAVQAVLTPPLREMRVISPDRAPGHDHPEPIKPTWNKVKAGIDLAIQKAAGLIGSAPTPGGLSFDGVGVGLSTFTPSSNPPDVNGRPGVIQYVQWNNTSFAVFNKTTGALLYGPVAGNTLFQSLGGVCASHNDGDPVVTYDLLSGRWVLSQFVVGGPANSYSHQCVAVSQTEDATGAYYLYDFVTDPTNFVDYPKLATWPDGYYMSGHVFNAAGTAYIAGRIYVFERSQMLAGGPARMLSANLSPITPGGSEEYGFLPADLDSLTPPPAGEAEFIIGPDQDATAGSYSARVAVTWGSTPTITLTESTIATLPYVDAPCVSNTNGRDCVPEPSPAAATDYLDNLADHYMHRLAYRNNGSQASPQESLLTNQTVAGTANSDTNHGAVRWYEFRNSGSSTTQPTAYQQGTYDPDSTYRWMGSIAMDSAGDIALGYSESSTTVKPSIFVTGRLASDAINTMGTEVNMMSGAGVQQAAGNRWGDYTAMAVDPVDQCTFYYTNEYLKTTGSFNWSTRIATYHFPTCVNAPAFGTVSGKVTSAQTGAAVSGVIVSLDNGYSGATDSNGNYSILAPAGSYTANASDPVRNCSYASPDNVPVFLSSGGTTTQNFTITGSSKLDPNGVTINDSTGNNNGVINKAECVALNFGLKNDGCATESAISATLTTSTSGVTVTKNTSTYPDMQIDATGTNATPFQISVDPSFVCGTPISLTLNLTYASGNKSVQFTVPSCAGGANQAIPSYQLTTADSTQPDRVGRTGAPSTCSGKASPGGGFTSTGPHYYKTWTFTNSGGAPACFTVTINAATGGPGDIESAAYLETTYNPSNVSANYLGDTGISGLGTTVSSASYSFTVPATSTFIVVVETANKTLSGSNASSVFSGTVSGFYDQTPGPGVCPAAPAAPVLSSAASRLNGFDTPIALSGQIGTEPRNGNGNYTLVLNFDTAVSAGAATVVSGTGTAGTPTFSGNSMLIPLSGVSDLQRLTVRATNVTNTSGGVLSTTEVTLGFIVGDTNGDSSVNSADVGQTKSQTGAALTQANCREDVNNDGMINSADVSLVKSKSGNALP
jgi:hypothetical protein